MHTYKLLEQPCAYSQTHVHLNGLRKGFDVKSSGLEPQLPAQVVQTKVALLLRAHFGNDIAETAAHEPILFGALKESKVLTNFIIWYYLVFR